MNRGGLVVAENGTPSLEVRFRSNGLHPFRKGNGRIHLNGTSGVKFKTRVEFFDPGFFVDAVPRNGGLSSAQLILDCGVSIAI